MFLPCHDPNFELSPNQLNLIYRHARQAPDCWLSFRVATICTLLRLISKDVQHCAIWYIVAIDGEWEERIHMKISWKWNNYGEKVKKRANVECMKVWVGELNCKWELAKKKSMFGFYSSFSVSSFVGRLCIVRWDWEVLLKSWKLWDCVDWMQQTMPGLNLNALRAMRFHRKIIALIANIFTWTENEQQVSPFSFCARDFRRFALPHSSVNHFLALSSQQSNETGSTNVPFFSTFNWSEQAIGYDSIQSDISLLILTLSISFWLHAKMALVYSHRNSFKS